MPTQPTNSSERARMVWRRCLVSAFRTGLACTIVGCLTLYGPASIHHQVAFPAFSYVTAILIVNDATFGDAIHGCWIALYATFQSLGPAMLSLWLIGPARFSSYTISVAVGLGGLIVVLPEGTTLLGKRIALGQIVIVYVIAYINGGRVEAVMHPLHVAASTSIGVLACVLALLLPFPRLACGELKENCKLLGENYSERLKLYVKAFCEQDSSVALLSISQAKSLAIASNKLLPNIKRYQASMKWEKLPFKILRPYYANSAARLQEVEIPLKGMEMALNTISSFPVRMMEGENKASSQQLKEHLNLTLKQMKNTSPNCDSVTVPESNAQTITQSFQTLQIIPEDHKDLTSLFFLFCIKLLRSKPPVSKPETDLSSSNPSTKQTASFLQTLGRNMKFINTKRLIPAFKCCLSLGLATLFGLLYSKENGFWSALPVAISFAAAREATFKVSNIKAQGTVLGTVYGVLGCFVFERFLPVRFLSLLPWFIVTSFLRRSKMYGQAGGISAAIGAVLILGRKNFGPTSEFAIARITETFIGLTCSIVVELVLQPTRAASLAKLQLRKSLESLSDCVSSIGFEPNKAKLMESAQKSLKLEVSELKRFIEEAEVEPNFWFMPFRSACYHTLVGSLSNMADLLHFSGCAFRFLEQESQKFGVWEECVKKLDGDLQIFREMLGSLINCLEDVTLMKSLKELDGRNVSCDPEMGKSPSPKIFKIMDSEGDGIESIMESYLEHSKEVGDKLNAVEGEEKSQMVLYLGALGFCLNTLMKETREIEKRIQEIVQLENLGKTINLYEISCKIRASRT
ncbi:uncharacterized protein [Euphorbia lathyris]|uniref:uncharacterized protein n=1 Tax=Euphorbia lathyris TaxID=212925 RepID=UPI003314080B